MSDAIVVNDRSLLRVLRDLASDMTVERISIGDLLAALQDRALAALLLVFALPNVLPTPPGLSAVLGTPLLFLSAQLALGRRPWLPGVITNRSMCRRQFSRLIDKATPWLIRAERLMRPRCEVLVRPPAEYAVGLVCLLLALIVFLPVPLGNMLPALAICLFALGVLKQDGFFVLAGWVTAIGAVALVWGVFFGMFQAALLIVSRF